MNSQNIMAQLNKMLATVELSYMTIARSYNLTYNGLMLLYMVAYQENVTQKQVGEALFIPKTSVHSVLIKLVNKGYLVLEKGSNNKEKYIVPTEEGKVLIQKIKIETEAIESSVINSISETEILKFVETSNKLANKLYETTELTYKKDGIDDF